MMELANPSWLGLLWIAPGLFVLLLSRRGRWPLRVGTALIRAGVAGLLVLAVLRPTLQTIRNEESRPSVVVLRDISRSVRSDADRAIRVETEFVQELEDVSEVEFGVFGVVPRSGWETVEGDDQQTGIRAAIEWAATRELESGPRHIILITDGHATDDGHVLAAARAQREGARVHAVSVGIREPVQPRIVGVVPPTGPRVGQTALLRVHVQGDAEARLSLGLETDDRLVAATPVSLRGEAEVGVSFVPRQRGRNGLRLVLRDGQRALDVAEIAFSVDGPPQLLLCDPDPGALPSLQRVLRDQGLEVQFATPDQLAEKTRDLSLYDAVVVSDLPQPPGDDAFEAFAQFVRRGGGLLFIGGTRVATKDWSGSSFEDLLPVRIGKDNVEQPVPQQPVHVCFVLDVSGSMADPLGSGGASKFSMMREAVRRSLGILPRNALVTLIVFHGTHSVVLERTPVTDTRVLAQAVDRMGVGGGTKIVPAMSAAVVALQAEQDAKRFMIVLSDGQSQPNPTIEMCKWINDADIALTTIAVGTDSNVRLMKWLAEQTSGVFHHCTDAATIPRIFIRESEAIKTLAEVKRIRVIPRLGPAAYWLGGIGGRTWPPLASALPFEDRKSPAVEIPLLTDSGAPLLATWRVGLGHVAAFASDAKAVWARRWVEWPEFQRFWSRVVSSVIPEQRDASARLDIRRQGDRLVLLADVTDAVGDRMSGAVLSAVASTRSRDRALSWERLPSGIFRATTRLSSQEPTKLTIVVETSAGELITEQELAFAPGSAEMQRLGPDLAGLRSLVSAGGGTLNATPAALRKIVIEGLHVERKLTAEFWPYFVFAAILLWPLDLALRRLAGTR